MYSLSFTEPSADGVIHHGIRFEATLPAADALVTEASLGLLITSPEGEIRVGDWGRVPEPSTFFLITTGALGLLGLRRRMRRSRPRSEGPL